ncbi:MAG: glycosyltransferase [Bacteroidales bacterium]|nr:glycosyltransferase [Bacteroidales bacterium]
MKDVSIIIPTFNRPDDLFSVLPFYFSQKDILEIIIVDDGSSLSYIKVIDQYGNYSDVRLVYHKNNFNMGAGACRNIGLALAQGDYILWGEDDAYLSDNYVEVLKSKILNKEFVFGSIYYGVHPDMNELDKHDIIRRQQIAKRKLFDYNLLEGYYRVISLHDIIVPWGHALFLVKKEAYSDVHYFEGYKINGYREETDAQVQMTINGYTAVYTSDTCCFHFPAKNNNGGQHSSKLLKYEFYKIINNSIFIKRHYGFLRSKYNIKHTRFVIELNFFLHVCSHLWNRVFQRIKRVLSTI